MSYIRRLGVIAEHGTLEAYRNFVLMGRDAAARKATRHWLSASTDAEHARVEELRMAEIDWRVDLAWVDQEIARDAAVAA
ncbi:hypothetical protein [Methylobacterium sp. WL7]|jgi:hypothetical protein|uniref:hypothetical protein n=1 Tax=Methylobacterium sp. WL7 TaxID=2603900 RepID=UPI0011CA74BE|nr:hypothetical protein [Methylobacterium sp. WL7]TXN48445.1 hypothetical protein FV233_01775 [Methylobacterium sp. WL7]